MTAAQLEEHSRTVIEQLSADSTRYSKLPKLCAYCSSAFEIPFGDHSFACACDQTIYCSQRCLIGDWPLHRFSCDMERLVGTRVCLVGLNSEQHNGKTGRVEKYLPENGRFLVILESDEGQQFKLKPKNIKVLV